MNADDLDVQRLFKDMTSTRIKAILGNNRWLIVDEAQRIPEIGLRLKLVTDQVPGVQVVATGSSSLLLASGIKESLTGRKREFTIFPLSYKEMVNETNLLEEHRMIPHRMVFGYYPEVVTSPGEEREVLHELSNSYLYKDIMTIDNISKPDKIVRLLQALAYQIGEQVSYNEVGQLIGLDSKTVEKYVDILEKNFIIFRLSSFSRNLRNEPQIEPEDLFLGFGYTQCHHCKLPAGGEPRRHRSFVGELCHSGKTQTSQYPSAIYQFLVLENAATARDQLP